MGYVIKHFGLGWTCRPTHIEQLASAIADALAAAPTFTQTEPAQRFVKFHGVENFLARGWFRFRGNLVPVDLLGIEFHTLHGHGVSIAVKLIFERRLHE